MKPKKLTGRKTVRQRRVIALGGQDPLLQRAVKLFKDEMVKRDGKLTWAAISERTSEFTANGKSVAVATMSNWMDGSTRGAMTRTLDATLHAFNKVLDIRDKRKGE